MLEMRYEHFWGMIHIQVIYCIPTEIGKMSGFLITDEKENLSKLHTHSVFTTILAKRIFLNYTLILFLPPFGLK